MPVRFLWLVSKKFCLLCIALTLIAVGAGCGAGSGVSDPPPPPPNGTDVLTWHFDNARSGLNASETVLTPKTVSPQNFGKLFSYTVDGYVYAQPLLVSGLKVNGMTHNVVFVATENDSVYAFDADSYGTGTPLWQVSLLQSGETPITNGAIQPVLGVTSTPAIDLSSNTMYVVSTESSGGSGTFRLHALDITSGAEKLGGPVEINASVPGTNSDSKNGVVYLTTSCVQRSALLLEKGSVFIGFGSCHSGWLLSYDATMPYGLDDQGRPIFLISTMAMHTQNLQADPRASLLVTQDDIGGDPLGASRVTLLGNVVTITQSQVAEARKLYLARYANSKYWVDFEDFSFYRMDVVDIYYVGGFGVMGWVSASEYDRSRPDPLADSMAEIIQHMNADHKDALVLLARKLARVESQEATMTTVDRLGFQVRLKTQDGVRGARIAFLREVSNPAETRNVLVEMVQQARSEL